MEGYVILAWLAFVSDEEAFTLLQDSGLPIVFQILREEGLDVARLNDGYKRAQRLWSKAMGNGFGENFDRIFNEPKQIVAIPPSGKTGNCESDANVCVG